MVISNCKRKRCGFCARGSLDCDTAFKSVCSGIKYNVEFDASCDTKNCVYLISCKICTMKYVGRTTTIIKTRFSSHCAHIRNGTEAKIMLAHFNEHSGHGLCNMVIKPIELCKDNVELCKREAFWITELNTIYPYGLNLDASFGNIKNAYQHVLQNKCNKTIYSLFNSVDSQRAYSGGKRKRANNNLASYNDEPVRETFDYKSWLSTVLRNCENDSDIVHNIRSLVFKLELINLKAVFLHVTELINTGYDPKQQQHEYILQVIRDMILHKLQKHYKKKSKPFLILDHVNKLVEKVNINAILSNQDVKSLFPVKSEYYSVPCVSFRYSKSIRSNIVNYREAIADPNHDNIECKCNKYDTKFMDNVHGHILTADMDIIQNKNLRDLVKQGLSYHDQKAPDKDKVIKTFVSGLDSYVAKTSLATHVSAICFKPWRSKVLEEFKSKLNICNTYKYYSVLKDPDVTKELKELQEDFVFTPVDKASSNVAMVCKRYYLDIMSSEIENSPTFELISDDKSKFLDEIRKNSGKFMSSNDRKIPYLYATVKMHKVPIKFRHITAARDSLFSEISIATSHCLKLLLQFARTSYKYRIKHIDNNIFIVDNREKVLQRLQFSNQSGDTNKSVTTWDFATLYTKIPHQKLKSKIEYFIRCIMSYVKSSSKDASFICYCSKSKKTYFSKTKSKANITYTTDDLIEAINTVIDNAYVLYHDKLYRQKIGIPMGTNVAPFLANIFLHVYEHEYLSKLIERGEIEIAVRLSKVYRYQDDCITINDSAEFAKHFDKIYPPEMTLECTNISKAVVTFLDLRISIFRGKFKYSSYDKRDDFNFKICSYPNLKGNIPTKASYGVYMSQLVRFCEINQTYHSFLSDIKTMTQKFVRQGFLIPILKGIFNKYCYKFMFKWSKYGVDLPTFVGKIFSL